MSSNYRKIEGFENGIVNRSLAELQGKMYSMMSLVVSNGSCVGLLINSKSKQNNS